VTFIGLQVLGSISLLSGNESSVVSELKSSENKNVGANVDNHVNLKKLKNDKTNTILGKGNKEESPADILKIFPADVLKQNSLKGNCEKLNQ